MKSHSKFISALVGLVAVLAAPVQADDSEVFTNSTFLATGVRPNVLFIVDTSGSMETEVENVYDPAKIYDGDCTAGKVYWRAENTGSLIPPSCKDNTQWVSVDNNRCRAAATGMATSGWWNGRTQMLNKSNTNTSSWTNAVADKDWKLECQSDHDKHGDLPGTTAAGAEDKRARVGTGNSDSGFWTSGSKSLLSWTNVQRVSMFSANYINWYTSTDAGTPKTRLEIVQQVATELITDLNGVNLGIMRYSADADGGMVMHPVSELTDTSRADMKKIVEDFIPEGNTPLSETMYEAYSYLAGKAVEFGNDSKVVDHYTPEWRRVNGVWQWVDVPVLAVKKSVPESKNPKTDASTTYDSPMDYSCQTTYVVYLTDGLPTSDNAADSKIESLSGKTCPAQIPSPESGHATSGRCFETLTRYMHETDLRTDVVGDQKVITYVIGFGSSIAKSKAYLEDVAKAGGGQAYTQSDAAGLASTLEDIFLQVQEGADTTFVAPSVSVNAFNRSQNLNELFISVFAPSKNTHWPGNLKKYRIYNNDIYGVSALTPAVDSKSGFFAEGSQALNSKDVQDGPKATLGGAANSLPGYKTRKMYTYLGGANKEDLTIADNAFSDDNKNITYDMVDAADDIERTRVINYARGEDLRDEDKDDNRDENHFRMGDPMHARPAILVHGGTEDAPVGTVFVPTNDGVLHAFDMASIGTSTTVSVKETAERWSFIPKEFLKRQGALYDDGPLATRDYALDGDVRVFKYDVNQNGVIDTADGDKAYIFFGTARGGRAYYALDVTQIDKPKFLWKIDNDVSGFGNLSRTWSTPQIARVQIGATGAGQNAQKFVLIFGGGYATANDTEPTPFSFSDDTVGNEIFMVDLETGGLLWRGGKSGAGLNYTNAKMTHSFPASITVLDTDGDRFADRMYAGDMGGQVWRFDIWNKNDVDKLVTGGVIASLGNKGVETPSVENNRRFYYAPDVAPFTMRGSHPFMNIAIGSGYRGHPLSGGETDASHRTHDRFYSIRDYQPFNKRTQKSYDDATVILDSNEDLVDVTDEVNAKIDDSKLGWKLLLNYPDWAGEKVLAEATTAGGIVFFPTFTPMTADPKDPCLARSMNRLYGVYATNGAPFVNWADGTTKDLDTTDRFTELKQKGIAPALSILSNPTSKDGMGICQVGAQILNRCVKVNEAVRSYWELK